MVKIETMLTLRASLLLFLLAVVVLVDGTCQSSDTMFVSNSLL